MKQFKKSTKILWIIPTILLAFGVSLGALTWFNFEIASSPIIPVKPNTPKSIADNTEPLFDKLEFSTTDPSSIWVITNKQHPLTPIEYTPTDLVNTNGATISNKAVADFEAMLAAARAESITLTAMSSYRSYSHQNSLYNNYITQYGQIIADTFSAKPGYSEHQVGLAIDFGSIYEPGCNFDTCFNNTIDGAWLAANASKYGFLLRYTAEKQSITGYKAESWHYRYIGRKLAAEMKKQSIVTLEEFFKISGGEIYLQQ